MACFTDWLMFVAGESKIPMRAKQNYSKEFDENNRRFERKV